MGVIFFLLGAIGLAIAFPWLWFLYFILFGLALMSR